MLALGTQRYFSVQGTQREEAVVAEAIASGIGAEAFERQMDERAADAVTQMSLDDEFAALFGDYAGPAPA